MTPVQLALETARYQLSKFYGCHIYDTQTHSSSRVIDNDEAIHRIEDALRYLGLMDM